MTTNEWKLVRIKDIGKVVTGRTPPTVITSYFGDEYPFITPSDMIGDKYISNPERWLSSQGATLLTNNCLPPNSIAVSCIGSQMGKVAMIVRTSFSNQQINTIIPKEEIAPDFIYYSLCTRREELKTLGSVGTATPILNKSSFENIPISLPPLPIQRKIAAILSAYDDLIENNTRRIAILEEMAQSLYREWFVHFRFPGHEKKRLIESELGLIPEGWEVVRFTDIADVLSGGTPRTTTSEYWNGPIPFFTPRDAPSSFYVTETEKSITQIGLRACNSKLYPRNTVFITARGTVGKVVLSAVDMAMNQSCYALQGRDGIDQFTIFLSIGNCIDQLKQNAHGAVFDTIIVDTFRMLHVVKPPLTLTNAFKSLVSPIFEMALNLLNKNTNLRETRDLLLPKLISGEVEVEGLDIQIGGEIHDRGVFEAVRGK